MDDIFHSLTKKRIPNRDVRFLVTAYPQGLPLQDHLCYCVGVKEGEQEKTVEIFRIVAQCYKKKNSVHYLVEWHYTKGESILFWVANGVRLRREIFEFTDTLSFKRSTFVHLKEGLVRLAFVPRWTLPCRPLDGAPLVWARGELRNLKPPPEHDEESNEEENPKKKRRRKKNSKALPHPLPLKLPGKIYKNLEQLTLYTLSHSQPEKIFEEILKVYQTNCNYVASSSS